MSTSADEFFDYLGKLHLNPQNLDEKIYDWSSEETLDFVHEANAHLCLLDEPSTSTFTFTANESLSGEPFPCAGIDCRLEKLDSLARFGALYGDKVYVTNPFEKYLDLNDISDSSRHDLLGDLKGLLYIKPLFRAGIFGVRNNLAACTCKECLRKMGAIDEDLESRLEKARAELTQTYLTHVKVELDYDDDELFLLVSGPEYLIEHGELVFSGELLNEVFGKYEKAGHKFLSRREVKKSGIIDSLVSHVIEDLLQQNIHVRYYHTHYISDRAIDLKAAASVDSPVTQKASNALLEGLQHSIPTVMNVQLSRLVKLRHEEGEAFAVYRDNMSKALKQAQALSTREAEELIDDTVRPAIHEIEHKLKSSRKLLVGSLKQDILVSAGYVGIGIFAGFVSKDVGTVLAAVGGLNFLKESATKLSQLRTAPEAVLENPYYFLWKLKNTKIRIWK